MVKKARPNFPECKVTFNWVSKSHWCYIYELGLLKCFFFKFTHWALICTDRLYLPSVQSAFSSHFLTLSSHHTPSFSLCHRLWHSASLTLTTSFAWTESKSTCDTVTQMYLCWTPTDAAAAVSRCREEKKKPYFLLPFLHIQSDYWWGC